MIKDFYKFEVNEDMYIDSTKRLRDAVHDIVIDLGVGEEISINHMSEILEEKYNILISSKVLNHIVFDLWWRKDDYSIIFTKKDKDWLDVWPFRKTIERKVKKTATLGKARRKIERDERTNYWKNKQTSYTGITHDDYLYYC